MGGEPLLSSKFDVPVTPVVSILKDIQIELLQDRYAGVFAMVSLKQSQPALTLTYLRGMSSN